MPISNIRLFLFFRILLGVLLLAVVADFFLASLPGSISDLFKDHYLAMAAGALILVLIFVRVNYFSYEDEYEIIHIRSKSLIFGRLSKQNRRYEFPKVLVTRYELARHPIYKKLTIHIHSSSGVRKTRIFNLSFVSRKDLDYVERSLSQIVERNQKGAGRQAEK
jgi:hypothetical protein